MLLILLCLFIAVVVVQFIYYIVFFGKFSFAKPQTSTPKRAPISVIVCAKNEEENVKNFISLLTQQNYPDYEIVLIDDASSDDTLELFEAFEKQYSNIKLVKVENNEAFWGNKKFALTLGINAAKNEYLLFTDADCYPVSNMAYKREEFFKVRGFMDHMKIRSGDDDLFINQAANSKNTTICYTSDSFTYSKPKTSFKDWFAQKRRHIATSEHYKGFDRAQLNLFYISQLLFILIPIILLAFQYQWIIVLSIIGFRYIFAWTTMGFAAGKLKEKDVMYWFPIIEVIIIFTQLNIFFSNMFSKPVQWK